jgi:hypothetical protein
MNKFQISFFVILSSLILFSIGCQDGGSLVGPENNSISNENQLDKKSHHDKKDSYSVQKKITRKKGGKITLKTSYDGPFGKKAKIKAEIKFKPGTVPEDTEFTMTLDPTTGMISFSPHMDFVDDKTATLTMSFKEVDLKKMKIDKEDIRFVYFDGNGQLVEMDYKKIWFKKHDFGVHQVEITHFSRYGFSR